MTVHHITVHQINSVEIEFNWDTHTYRVGGVIVPSVTQIIDSFYDFSMVDGDVMERSSEFGRAAHTACYLHDISDLDEAELDPALVPRLDAWIRFRHECKFAPSYSEQIVYSKTHKFCGTLDSVGYMNGQPCIVDIKTCTSLTPAVGLQLAGYEIAAREQGLIISGLIGLRKILRIAVQLNCDGKYKLEPYNDQSDGAVFLSLLNVRNWRKNHGYPD